MADTAYQRNYTAMPMIAALSDSPRFGHPRDISLLFSGNSQEISDYLYGLLFVGCLTFGLLLTWGILLVVFRCMGSLAVGYLSGSPFTFYGANPRKQPSMQESAATLSIPESAPSSPTEPKRASNMYRGNGDDEFDNKTRFGLAQYEVRRANRFVRRNKIIRAVFVLCSLIFATCAILGVTHGFANLQNTVNTVNQNARNIEAVVSEARDIIQVGLTETVALARSVRGSLRVQLAGDSFCPTDPTLENNELAKRVYVEAQAALQILEDLGDFNVGQISGVESSLDTVQKGASTVEDYADEVNLMDWPLIVIVSIYVIIPCIFIAACFCAYYDISVRSLSCCIDWCLLPLFILMTCIAIIVASAMIMGAGVHSDFCLPGGRDSSPDTTILRITEQAGYADTIVFQVAEWYISQCKTEDPFSVLEELRPEVDSGLQTLRTLDTSFKEGTTVETLALYCNRDFEPVEAVVESMNELLGTLTRSLDRTLELISCDVIVPIYTSTTYDATCQYSMSAVFWVFSTTLIMSVFGLLMITFRAAYKNDVYTDDEYVASVDEVQEQEQYVDNSGQQGASVLVDDQPDNNSLAMSRESESEKAATKTQEEEIVI